MNVTDLRDSVAALAQHLDHRVNVWRAVVDEKGREIGRRIYRGSFQRSPTLLEDLPTSLPSPPGSEPSKGA